MGIVYVCFKPVYRFERAAERLKTEVVQRWSQAGLKEQGRSRYFRSNIEFSFHGSAVVST